MLKKKRGDIVNKKQARIAKKRRLSKVNYYITRLSLSGETRLPFNFHDKRNAYHKAEELVRSDPNMTHNVIYSVSSEKRMLGIQYDD